MPIIMRKVCQGSKVRDGSWSMTVPSIRLTVTLMMLATKASQASQVSHPDSLSHEIKIREFLTLDVCDDLSELRRRQCRSPLSNGSDERMS